MIKIDNLTISYDGKRAVSELSLELIPGEITGLVGESGSGKSVTALTVMGLLSQTSRAERSALMMRLSSMPKRVRMKSFFVHTAAG